MSRDEFDLYDIIKTLSFLGFIASMIMLCMGKKALMSTKKQNTKFSARIARKGIFSTVILALLALAIGHNIKQAKWTFRRHQAHSRNMTMPEFMHVHQQEREQEDEQEEHYRRNRRNLQESDNMETKIRGNRRHGVFFPKANQNSDCRATYKDETSCDADAGCSWCVSGAVKPACNTLADAKSLPASIFRCDKVQAKQSTENFTRKEKRQAMRVGKHGKRDQRWSRAPPAFAAPPKPFACPTTWVDRDSCNQDARCSWCRGHSVPNKCFAFDDAEKA
jgi:hypothetical protein